MLTRPRPRLTIGQVMGLIAGFAATWALVAQPGAARFVVWVLLPLALLIVGPILVMQHLVDGSLGLRCPHCGGETMERRAVSSFGSRYYLCSSCGVRCRRGSLFGVWEDASGPEYDEKYRKKPGDDPWSAPPGLEDEDLIYSKTHGHLVRNKRLRRPDDPNGPGLE